MPLALLAMVGVGDNSAMWASLFTRAAMDTVEPEMKTSWIVLPYFSKKRFRQVAKPRRCRRCPGKIQRLRDYSPAHAQDRWVTREDQASYEFLPKYTLRRKGGSMPLVTVTIRVGKSGEFKSAV